MKPQSLISAFTHAFNGISHFITHDRNGKIHSLAGILVALAGFYFNIAATEWCILLLCMAIVIGFEILNHALEKLCDVVHKAPHPYIKIVKDVAAAAVLLSAILSVIIGSLIFIPKISALL